MWNATLNNDGEPNGVFTGLVQTTDTSIECILRPLNNLTPDEGIRDILEYISTHASLPHEQLTNRQHVLHNGPVVLKN